MEQLVGAFWRTDLGRLVALIVACALLSSIELLVPLFRYRQRRLRRSVPNLTLTMGVVLTNLAFASLMAAVANLVARRHFGLFSGLHEHDGILLVLGVAGLDCFAYLAHLLLHKIPWGWRFHRVHHSEMEVDVTTAFRQHPGETIWRVLWQGLGIALLGLPFWVVPIYVTISGINALAEHSNVRMSHRWDAALRVLFVTPNMHKIHHSCRPAETDSNYSNVFSLWDRLCGTHTRSTDYAGLRYGLDGFEDCRKQALRGLLVEPFRNG